MYVTQDDYKTRISSDLLAKIASDTNITPDKFFSDASKVAEDTIASYAGVLYDIAPEFIKTAQDRNYLLVKWALNIATYELYQRIDDEQVPEKVIKNYDDTIEDLEKLATGKFPLALPPKPNDPTGGEGDESVVTDGTGLIRMGSQKKRSHLP